MKKIFTVCVAAAVMMSLLACGKTEENQQTSGQALETETQSSSETVESRETAESKETLESKETENAESQESETKDTINSVGMANPWVECDTRTISDEFYLNIDLPENAQNVLYQFCESIELGEIDFTVDGVDYCYRVSYSKELEDHTGMYYDWDTDEEITLMADVDDFYDDYQGNEGRLMSVHTEEGDVKAVLWYDPVLMRSFSLTASGKDLSGLDIQALAESMYFQPDPDTLNVAYMSDGWLICPDGRQFNSHDENGVSTFSFYSHFLSTAGSNVVSIYTVKDSDYLTVLNEIKEGKSDPDGEITPCKVGAMELDAYSYEAPNAKAESGLEIKNSYIAVPSENDVIVIETFITVETDEEVGNTVSSAINDLIGTFDLNAY